MKFLVLTLAGGMLAATAVAAPVLDTREVNNVSVTKPQLSQGNG